MFFLRFPQSFPSSFSLLRRWFITNVVTDIQNKKIIKNNDKLICKKSPSVIYKTNKLVYNSTITNLSPVHPRFYLKFRRGCFVRMDNMEEVWRQIVGYENWYEVSNLGRVRSLDRIIIYKNGRKRKHKSKYLNSSSCYKYPIVVLYSKNKLGKIFLIHRLVAEHFIPNPNRKKTVNHKNGNKKDNRAENLEWSSYKENNIHALKNGLRKKSGEGEKSPYHKLTKEDVLSIRKKYKKGINDTNRGYSLYMLADEYGVGSTTIFSIIKRKTWKHI